MSDTLSGVDHIPKFKPKESIQTVLITEADNDEKDKAKKQEKEKSKRENKKDTFELSDSEELMDKLSEAKVVQKHRKETENQNSGHLDIRI